MRKSYLLLPLIFLLAACPSYESESDKKILELEKKVSLLETKVNQQRYQLVISQQFPGRYTYLIDTQKGKIWQPTTFTDIEGRPTAWVEQDVIDSSGEIGQTFLDYMKWHKPVKPSK